MKPAFCLDVHLVCFLWRFEPTEKFCLAVDADLGFPKSSIRFYAKESRLVVASWFSLILNVHGLRHIAQVCDFVVRSVPINMVNVPNWPCAMNIKPNEPVNKSHMAINHKLKVASCWIASNISSLYRAFVDAPTHDASFWIVGKQLVQSRLSDHVAPHQCGKPSKVAAGGDESLVPRRVSCPKILP